MSARLTILPPLGALVVRVLGVTWRIEVGGEEHVAQARRHAPCVIFAFWHGRLLPFAYTHRNRGARVLASQHEDGELLGRTIRHLGFGHVRGSSTRGGTRAILDLAEAIRAGHDVGVTVDGPRGPRHVVKAGVVQVAKMTGCRIVPITSASHRHRTFASWDGFELPHPWTRVLVRHGPPVFVPADADEPTVEAKRRELEQSLNDLTAGADRDAAA